MARPFLLSVVPLTALAVVGGTAPVKAQSRFESDEVMAAFVTRFPQFVEWPDDSFVGNDTVVLCVAEPDPFGEVLDDLLDEQQASGRPLQARRVDLPDAIDGCHLLFVSSVAPLKEEFLEAAAGRPVLTVGEGSAFLDEGGMISLRIFDRRVRFEVNAGAADAARLVLSSQLLGLALDVRRGPE